MKFSIGNPVNHHSPLSFYTVIPNYFSFVLKDFDLCITVNKRIIWLRSKYWNWNYYCPKLPKCIIVKTHSRWTIIWTNVIEFFRFCKQNNRLFYTVPRFQSSYIAHNPVILVNWSNSSIYFSVIYKSKWMKAKQHLSTKKVMTNISF